jgi:hypothetical protein
MCPKCKSENVQGLVAAFWAPVNASTQELKTLVIFETEMGPERLCSDCDFEFEE